MDIYEAPFGNVFIKSNNKFLTHITFYEEIEKIVETEISIKVKKQLEEYFLGKRFNFDIPIQLEGTVFQKNVWYELCKIPYGKTLSYQDIAINVGSPKACRAVGLANNKNNISIVIPCHRVIGKNGSLTGFGGGLDKKDFLLKHEKKWSELC